MELHVTTYRLSTSEIEKAGMYPDQYFAMHNWLEQTIEQMEG